MTLSRDQRINRLRKRLVELHLWTVRATSPLDRWTLNRVAHPAGAPWPSREGVAAFHHPEVIVPGDWPLERTRLELDLGGEGLVQVDYGGGKPPQRRKSRPKRPRTVLPVWHEVLCADPDARSSPLPIGTAIAVAEDRPQS